LKANSANEIKKTHEAIDVIPVIIRNARLRAIVEMKKLLYSEEIDADSGNKFFSLVETHNERSTCTKVYTLHNHHGDDQGDDHDDDDDDDDDDVTRPVYLATFRVINGGFINGI
jgi:hypothetical protein